MIGPAPVPGMAEAMAGLTGEMTGLTLQQAWQRQGFVDPVEADYGLDFGVDVVRIGTNKPAISGDTEGSILGSEESDPVDAFEEYADENPNSVDSTTGGLVEGSNVYAMAYSLMQTYPTSSMEVVKAVVPVAVPIQQAYVAISQALGVSMNISEMAEETKQAFVNAITSAGNLIYDSAENLVKAWWDGVNILFPKKAIDAINDTIEELGISEGGSVATSDLITNWSQPIRFREEYLYFTTPDDGIGDIVPENGARYTIVRLVRGSTMKLCIAVFGDSPEARVKCTTTWDYQGSPMTRTLTYTANTPYQYNGQTAYRRTDLWNSGISQYRTPNIPPDIIIYDPDNFSPDGPTAWTVVYGNVTGYTYPDGTSSSEASRYTPATIPSAGNIAIDGDTTEEVVPIHLPVDPDDTTDDTTDPISETDEETINDLPVPPIPLPIPDTNVSNPDVPLTNPTIVNQDLIDELVEELATTLDPQPPQSSGMIPFFNLPGIDDGQGGSQFPSIVPASGPGLIHVYNPTPSEMVSFGNWLWVTYADATIDKIWNNPFDGIIGAFELYATPEVDGSDNIRSGFLTCPTTAALVRQRYIEIDCGSIVVPEFYGNYLDYSPYSQAYVYLPFIGINEVSIDDIVGHAINIRYRVDTYNGSCIAMIYVAKRDYRNLCYQFAGNCGVEIPIAGGSQAAIKAGMMQAEAYARAGMMQAVGHLFGGIGSALLGNLGGVLSSFSGIIGNYANASAGVEAARVANKSTVQHSGTFGASHGAMGYKNPFIMIRNPIQVKVVNYNDDYGFPAHKRVIVGGCTGYLRVREVNVISANATDEEKSIIEAMLKNGVYVS